MFENVRADLKAAQRNNEEDGWWKQSGWTQGLKAAMGLGAQAVLAYRLGHWMTTVRIPVVRQLLLVGEGILRRLVRVWTGAFISPHARIGPGFVIHSPSAIGVGTTTIGKNCTIATGVLVGCGIRSIGDNVYLGAGAKIIGDVKIGNNVVVMPNSLILTDVPDNTTIVGVPARIKLRGGRPQRFRPVKPGNGTQASAKAAAKPPVKPAVEIVSAQPDEVKKS